MWTYTVSQVASFTGGVVRGNGDTEIHGVFTDSRVTGNGLLFVALPGENFDGHDFVKNAAEKGASAAMVSRYLETVDLPQIVVPDTLDALSLLATTHRNRFQIPVAAVTGSVGKTTTRSLLCAILSVSKKVHQPEKNFNNHIGVPLTVLKLDDQFDAAVFELGCSGFNEIGPLTRIVRPDVAVVTNVGSAHLEKLKNLDGVAQAKGELFANQHEDGWAVVNLDDPHIVTMPRTARRMITFSAKGQRADVELQQRVPTVHGQTLQMKLKDTLVEIPFSLPGEHNAIDAVAASAAALAMGAGVSDIVDGLGSVQARPGRFHVIEKNGRSIIDDTYNANPTSMAASLGVLAEMVPAPQRIAVLGDMLELGENASAAHFAIGELAGSLPLKKLFVIGTFAQSVREGAIRGGMSPSDVICCQEINIIAEKAAEISESGDALLIKGSRGMKLERVVQAILEG